MWALSDLGKLARLGQGLEQNGPEPPVDGGGCQADGKDHAIGLLPWAYERAVLRAATELDVVPLKGGYVVSVCGVMKGY